jgi:hypothetical protein
MTTAPREPWHEPFSVQPRWHRPTLEPRRETTLSRRFRAHPSGALQALIARRRLHQPQAVLALLRAQITQLLLFLTAQLPKLRAAEIASLLQACLSLLGPQVSDLPILLCAQLSQLGAIESARLQ